MKHLCFDLMQYPTLFIVPRHTGDMQLTEPTTQLLRTTNCVNDVPGGVFTNASAFLQQPYLRALEEAAPAGMEFRYVYGKCASGKAVLYYFQVINLSSREIGQIINFQPYSSIMRSISGLVQSLLLGTGKDRPNYLLVGGNMCLSGLYGIHSAVEDQEEASGRLFQAIELCARELKHSGKVVATILKDFPEKQSPYTAAIRPHRFNRLSMDPIMRMEIRKEWKSLQDYLGAVTAKYRQRYQQARKKIQNCSIRPMSLQEMEAQGERINELYRAVQEKSPVRILQPDASYLIALKKHLGEQVDFRGIFLGEQLIGFLTGIRDHFCYEAHHIGMDYAYVRTHGLYLNILYWYIEMAIASGATTLSFGRTAIEMKTTVGAVPVMHEAWLKLNNKMLNSLVSHLIPDKSGEEWIPRNPFKD